MLTAHDSFHPDAIVAPFLTKRVPERLWRNNATCPVSSYTRVYAAIGASAPSTGPSKVRCCRR